MPPANERLAWPAAVIRALKKSDVRLATYIPDRVLKPLIDDLHADRHFTTICATREEEAIGIVTGAWMGGMRGVVLMQTSGFATLPNVLASLSLPYQIPAVMFISERGTLGEFNIGQVQVCQTMRPALQAMNIEHHTLRALAEVEFVVERSIKQAAATQASVAFILNPLLTSTDAPGEH